jgi:hypothetical protein
LADIIMKFSRNSGPLLLLRANEPPGQLANLLVADAKLTFLCANANLGSLAPGSLHEEAYDKKCLKHDQRDRSDNVPAILFP